MIPPSDTASDLEAWRKDWHAPTPALEPAEQIRDHVRRRHRWITTLRVAEGVVGVVALIWIPWRLWLARDGWDQAALAALTAMTLGVMAFSWWNWRDTSRAAADTTQAFVALSLERSRRMARHARAGWWVLAVEALVFIPWMAHRLYGSGEAPPMRAQVFGWAFLASMLGLGVWGIRLLQNWTHRDAQAVEAIVAELEGESDRG